MNKEQEKIVDEILELVEGREIKGQDISFKCNMCGSPMRHVEYKGTHIYGCPDCPNIQLEYLDSGDLAIFQEFVEWDSEEKWTGKIYDTEGMTDIILDMFEKNYNKFKIDDLERVDDNQFDIHYKNGQKFTVVVTEE